MLKIVSDTTTGLTQAMAAQYDIELIPQRVMFGVETLRDGVDITNEVFLQRLKMSKEFPTTSQPPAGEFADAFTRRLDAGHAVLCITVSSLLSGTYNSAEAARQQIGSDKIAVVDSKNVAAGEALIVLEAARMANQGCSMAGIMPQIDRLIAGMHLDFVLDTLEYLVRGGRVSGAAGFVGTLLRMKPVLTIREGRVEPLERVRTKSKAMACLREIIDEGVRGKHEVRMGVVHTDMRDAAEAMAQEFRRMYCLDDCLVLEMPPAVAAHAGPGALGAAYYAEN
jgi:DegV family protein with EDD domain